MDEGKIREIVSAWIEAPRLRRLAGAMNSDVWLAESGGERFVVKVMDRSGLPGLRVAGLLEAGGLPAGAPVAETTVGEQLVALLRHVPGEPLGRGDAELVGETLGRVHALLSRCEAPAGLDRWPWRWLNDGDIEDGQVRRGAAAAIHAAERLAPALTHGILHGDPAPEAFVRDRSRVGVIDWGSALHGPLLYDVASAQMYAGGGAVTGYTRTGPLLPAELEHVDAFVKFRWAVQAWYFSWRIANDVRTGIRDARENAKGLADARAALVGAGS